MWELPFCSLATSAAPLQCPTACACPDCFGGTCVCFYNVTLTISPGPHEPAANNAGGTCHLKKHHEYLNDSERMYFLL